MSPAGASLLGASPAGASPERRCAEEEQRGAERFGNYVGRPAAIFLNEDRILRHRTARRQAYSPGSHRSGLPEIRPQRRRLRKISAPTCSSVEKSGKLRPQSSATASRTRTATAARSSAGVRCQQYPGSQRHKQGENGHKRPKYFWPDRAGKKGIPRSA